MKVSSDDNLLNMIRDKDRKRQHQNREQVPIQETMEAQIPDTKQGRNTIMLRSWQMIDLMLFVIAVAVSAHWMWMYSQPSPWPELPTIPTLSKGEAERYVDQFQSQGPSFDQFSTAMMGTNLFQAPWEKPQEPKPQQAVQTNLVPLEERYQITGVVVGDKSNVIIEDTQARETIFLEPGDVIDGAEVVEIGDGWVLFSYQGGLVEMTY